MCPQCQLLTHGSQMLCSGPCKLPQLLTSSAMNLTENWWTKDKQAVSSTERKARTASEDLVALGGPIHQVMKHMSSGGNLLPKFMPISFFRRASRFWGVSGRLALQWGKSQCILVCHCLVPWLPQVMQISISFRSRSDLVLDADHSWDFLGTYLVLQACISFGSVSDKSGPLLFCLIYIKMPLLILHICITFREETHFVRTESKSLLQISCECDLTAHKQRDVSKIPTDSPSLLTL